MPCERFGYEIAEVRDLDLKALGPLVSQSLAEGFGLVERLASDWASGKHRFDGPHEALFVVSLKGELVAVGGFTPDSFTGDPAIGRVRRVYVSADHRRRGIGKLLLAAIIGAARSHFKTLVLRTDTERAASFYATLGFRADAAYPDATHFMHLG